MPATKAHTTEPVRVLLVEDDIDGADAIQQYLEFRGYAVSVAGSAEDALQRCLAPDATATAPPSQGSRAFQPSQPFQIVITDLHLPGMRGEELAQRLLQRGGAPRPWLIAISGEHGQAQAPFDARLPKPCRPKELIATIEALLRRPTA